MSSFQTPSAWARARTGRRQWPDQSSRPAGQGIAVAGAMTAGAAGTLTGAAAAPLQDEAWSLEFGSVLPAVQTPSRFEKDVVRSLSNPKGEFRNSHARTPHHLLSGTVTPNSLHFSINHCGVPDIDPRRAQVRHPRHGAPAPRVHAEVAVALSAGDAHGIRGMRRQFGADVLQRAAAGDGAGNSRTGIQFRMGRGAAVHFAR